MDVILTTVGSFTVKLAVSLQPLLSVTVKSYVPASSLLISCVAAVKPLGPVQL